MEDSDIASYLPPIAVSLGAMLPILISKPPFSVAENARLLISCIMALIVWLAYWAVYMAAHSFVYRWLAPTCLVGSILVLGVVFIAANRPTPTVAAGKPAPPREIDRPRYLYWYVVGLFLVSVAAALYNGPKGQVRVELDLVLNNGESLVDNKGRVARVTASEAQPVKLDPWWHGTRIQFLIDADEFNKTEEFQADITVNEPTGGPKPLTMHGKCADKLKLYQPDTVPTYHIDAIRGGTAQ